VSSFAAEDACEKFATSCHNAIALDLHHAKQYLMPFAGTSNVLVAPVADIAEGDSSFGSEGSREFEDSGSESLTSSEDYGESESSALTEDNSKSSSGSGSGSKSSFSSSQHSSSSRDSQSNYTALTGKNSGQSLGNLNKFAFDRSSSVGSKALSYLGVDGDPSSAMSMCNRKNHPQYLHDQVYKKHCEETTVRINSGIGNVLLRSPTCFCNLEVVSFANFLLGDRGIQGALPLFKSGRRLRCLNLQGNAIREKGFKQIGTCLQEAGTAPLLSVLDLSNNPLSSKSAPELTRLLEKRRSILMLGLVGTDLPSVRRQQALRQTIDSFARADPNEMCKAWQLASPGGGFSDSELWVLCTPIVESQCSREQLAECMELVANYRAGRTQQQQQQQGPLLLGTPGGCGGPSKDEPQSARISTKLSTYSNERTAAKAGKSSSKVSFLPGNATTTERSASFEMAPPRQTAFT
jgi:hypothetical protein